MSGVRSRCCDRCSATVAAEEAGTQGWLRLVLRSAPRSPVDVRRLGRGDLDLCPPCSTRFVSWLGEEGGGALVRSRPPIPPHEPSHAARMTASESPRTAP